MRLNCLKRDEQRYDEIIQAGKDNDPEEDNFDCLWRSLFNILTSSKPMFRLPLEEDTCCFSLCRNLNSSDI